jgi:hypothetical protein
MQKSLESILLLVPVALKFSKIRDSLMCDERLLNSFEPYLSPWFKINL